MSPKKRKSSNINGDDTSIPTPGNPPMQSPSDLPSKRRGKAIKRTSAPFYKTSFNTFIYSLALVAVFIVAFYAWRLMAWKREVGGWMNLALGRKPPVSADGSGSIIYDGGTRGRKVSAKISELAEVLGIPPATLATAIASAVSQHVPPATLSSISKNEASTASVVRSLLQDENEKAKETANSFASKLGNVVGFDEADVGLD